VKSAFTDTYFTFGEQLKQDERVGLLARSDLVPHMPENSEPPAIDSRKSSLKWPCNRHIALFAV